jgi:hypothetical protein
VAALVWLLIHHRRKLSAEQWVTLPARDLDRLSVNRFGKMRALKALEALGLIQVLRERGRTARVRLARED